MGERVEDRLDGEVCTFRDVHHSGSYYRIKKNLCEIDSDKIGRYIKRMLPIWQAGHTPWMPTGSR